jgi:hypothetical protein
MFYVASMNTPVVVNPSSAARSDRSSEKVTPASQQRIDLILARWILRILEAESRRPGPGLTRVEDVLSGS